MKPLTIIWYEIPKITKIRAKIKLSRIPKNPIKCGRGSRPPWWYWLIQSVSSNNHRLTKFAIAKIDSKQTIKARRRMNFLFWIKVMHAERLSHSVGFSGDVICERRWDRHVTLWWCRSQLSRNSTYWWLASSGTGIKTVRNALMRFRWIKWVRKEVGY